MFVAGCVLLHRPDMTLAVEWALNNNYLIYLLFTQACLIGSFKEAITEHSSEFICPSACCENATFFYRMSKADEWSSHGKLPTVPSETNYIYLFIYLLEAYSICYIYHQLKYSSPKRSKKQQQNQEPHKRAYLSENGGLWKKKSGEWAKSRQG